MKAILSDLGGRGRGRAPTTSSTSATGRVQGRDDGRGVQRVGVRGSRLARCSSRGPGYSLALRERHALRCRSNRRIRPTCSSLARSEFAARRRRARLRPGAAQGLHLQIGGARARRSALGRLLQGKGASGQRFTATDAVGIDFTPRRTPRCGDRKPHRAVRTAKSCGGGVTILKATHRQGAQLLEAGVPAANIDYSVPAGGIPEALKAGRITCTVHDVHGDRDPARGSGRSDRRVRGSAMSYAYGVRKDAPELLKALNEYLATSRAGLEPPGREVLRPGRARRPAERARQGNSLATSNRILLATQSGHDPSSSRRGCHEALEAVRGRDDSLTLAVPRPGAGSEMPTSCPPLTRWGVAPDPQIQDSNHKQLAAPVVGGTVHWDTTPRFGGHGNDGQPCNDEHHAPCESACGAWRPARIRAGPSSRSRAGRDQAGRGLRRPVKVTGRGRITVTACPRRDAQDAYGVPLTVSPTACSSRFVTAR